MAVLSETLDKTNTPVCPGLGAVGKRKPWWVVLKGTEVGSGYLYRAELGEITGNAWGREGKGCRAFLLSAQKKGQVWGKKL